MTKYRTCVGFTCGLNYLYVFSTVGISLKFGGIPLMFAVHFREKVIFERVNLTLVRYTYMSILFFKVTAFL